MLNPRGTGRDHSGSINLADTEVTCIFMTIFELAEQKFLLQ